MERARLICASEEEELEGGRGLVARDCAGSRKDADGDGEATARRRKRKGRRSWATGTTAPVIAERCLPVKGVEHAYGKLKWRWGGVAGAKGHVAACVSAMSKVTTMQASLNTLLPSRPHPHNHTANAYLRADDEKDESKRKGVELGHGKPVVWCGQNGKCIAFGKRR